MPRTFPYRW